MAMRADEAVPFERTKVSPPPNVDLDPAPLARSAQLGTKLSTSSSVFEPGKNNHDLAKEVPMNASARPAPIGSERELMRKTSNSGGNAVQHNPIQRTGNWYQAIADFGDSPIEDHTAGRGEPDPKQGGVDNGTDSQVLANHNWWEAGRSGTDWLGKAFDDVKVCVGA